MKILIDVGHPADVHLFRNFYFKIIKKGHKVLITVRERGITMELLKAYKIPYVSYAKHSNNLFLKLFSLPFISLKLFFVAKKFRPDILLGLGSITASNAAFLLRKPYICYEDTGNKEQMILYKYFTSTVIAPSNLTYDFGKRHIRIASTKEIAYLHPNYFIPDISIMNDLGIKKGEKYILLRFVNWTATHDFGHKGISYENKIKTIKEFSKYAKVFISSENELSDDLKKYQFKIAPEKMHDAIAFSSLVFGESATMATEGAVLGIPSIYLDNTGRYYTRDLDEKYNLLFNYTESNDDQRLAIEKGIELLQQSEIKVQWQQKRAKMLAEKIDVTAFMVWFIENYPESKKIMKENPDYQYNFR